MKITYALFALIATILGFAFFPVLTGVLLVLAVIVWFVYDAYQRVVKIPRRIQQALSAQFVAQQDQVRYAEFSAQLDALKTRFKASDLSPDSKAPPEYEVAVNALADESGQLV